MVKKVLKALLNLEERGVFNMTNLEIQNQKLMNQERVFKLADFLSKSDIIPKHFQGKPANVFIALEMANRLQIDFFELANGLYVVHGSPAFSGTFTIGRINASGKFKTKLNFKTEGTGDNMRVTAYAQDETGELCSATVGMDMAIAEGWTKSKSGMISKYKTMPEQMLTYRSATFFCRKHCPEVMLGGRTVEEVEDQHIVETIEAPSIVKEIVKEDVEKSNAQNVAKLLKLVDEAIGCGIPESSIASMQIDMKKPSEVLHRIDLFETMIADRLIEVKQGVKK